MKMKSVILNTNESVAIASYKFIDVACVYPITPSSEMAEKVDKLSFKGEKNLFGQKVLVREMQSEAGCAAMLHGALSSGALSSTFTCSQGLLLMIPEMFRISAECLPGVIHVSSRSIAKHALSILGDHSDVYSCRQTGWSMLCSSSVQEAHDFAIISHLVSIDSQYPILHFFDGFRTSHEIRKIRILEEPEISSLINMDAVDNFRSSSLSPERNFIRGSNQVDDVYFQCCEYLNFKKDLVCENIKNRMDEFNLKFSTNYHPFDYYGSRDAEYVVISMGSVCDTIEEAVDYLLSIGKKVGMIKVRLFRPFSYKFLGDIIPKTVKKISVLDKSKELGSSGEPLYLDVLSAISDLELNVKICHGRFGIGGKNTTSKDIINVFENMFSEYSKKEFTIGIVDDIYNLSLNIIDDFNFENKSIECKFFGLGSDGMIGATKNITSIIGNNTEFDIQYYPQYDSKKSGGLTISHLRFGSSKIKSEYYISKADYVVCSQQSYLFKYDFTNSLKKNSKFLINCSDKLEIPIKLYDYIRKNKIKVYVIDANKIASELGLNQFYGIVMQGAFLKICNELKFSNKKDLVKIYVKSFYYNKNKKLIDSNLKAIDYSFDQVKKISVNDIEKIEYLNFKDSNNLPVSSVSEFFNGNTPCGTAELNQINNIVVPKWIPNNCSQCGFCSFVCPHGCITIHGFEEDKDVESVNLFGIPELKFSVQINSKHCTGCSLCEKVCPGMKGKKALEMGKNNFSDCKKIKNSDKVLEKFSINTIKGSQFRENLMKFSSACPGCGEVGYAKLLTQLFGERLIISNATGCSSIWGGNFGMLDANRSIRLQLLEKVQNILTEDFNEKTKQSCIEYIQTFDIGEENLGKSINLIDSLEKIKSNKKVKDILKNKEYLSKKSFWIFGGDGWAYDIGFGGLDHILASGENINILVFDTEIYSNTGGQASKSTPKNAVASFELGGKSRMKKNLSKMMMEYGNIYIAQISMGANMNQCLKAMIEAENYNGPSLIIAYSTCIGHGIKGGLSNSLEEQKLAVESGHFELFRFNPNLNKLIHDSKIKDNSKKFFENESRFIK